ncbi:hypothetical protein Back11_17460 [Paenibacillus baekrokdamisoli]|uniref:SnoaL-like domain-containing protein n=1 Tax=Paenibacillus baekrokdamisoli TaxID=1712516 RepID=A0A3G9J3M4_9BACL|nr:hypothetical protein Back11_17460 [Paenibacillus baekrokdamisoli]
MSYIDALEKYIAATNSHDFSQVQECIDSQAVYWFSDTSCTSTAEIQRYFENA